MTIDEWTIFMDYIDKSINLFVPLIIFNKPKNTENIPKHMKRLIVKKRKYWKLAHTAKTRRAKNKFKELATKCKAEYIKV